MLSQVERGQANPTFSVAYRIAGAFGLSIAELVEEAAESTIEVIKAADQAYHFRDDGDCRIRGLVPRHLEKEVEFYELRLAPDNSLDSPAHIVDTHEFITVQQGLLEVTSGDSSAKLEAGDSAYYPADTAHSIRNCGKTDATAFLVAIYRSRLSSV
jgi:quercetin dioxygenase-like cupin family protein